MSGDVLVIGGGINGLVAATYLARAGKRVTLLEAQDHLGGFCAPLSVGDGFMSPGAQTLYALDPRVIAELKLVRHGLKFAARDMALVGLHGDGKHIVLQRDVHATAANIAVHSAEDARAWPHFRRELFDLARAMRQLWWGETSLPKAKMLHRIERIAKTGAVAWLDSWFESDALKTALCFDATEGGLSPIEPGSALTLVWRAAQEMSGLQGAVARVSGKTLVDSLVAAARTAGVDIQTGTSVVALMSDGESVSGVRLENGDTRNASQIVCSFSRGEFFLTVMPPLADGIAHTAQRHNAPTGQARILLVLHSRPQFGGSRIPTDARLILSESSGAVSRADFAARSGRVADELSMEIVIFPTSDDARTQDGPYVVSMRVRPVPALAPEGWQSLKPILAARAIQAFERFAPGTADQIVAAKIFAPDDQDGVRYQPTANVEHLLSGYETRINSTLRGLLFSGAGAEPVPAVSGRAARLAASMLAGHK